MKQSYSLAVFSLALVTSMAFFLDDDTTTTSPPPPTTQSLFQVIDCDFEKDLCGWDDSYDPIFNWVRVSGRPYEMSAHLTGDHTGSKTNYYLYLDGHRGELTTPPTTVYGDGGCLTFYYFLGSKHHGSITVKMDDKVIFDKVGDQGNHWNKANINITSSNEFKLAFDSYYSVSEDADLAIDDVSMTYDKLCS